MKRKPDKVKKMKIIKLKSEISRLEDKMYD